MNHHAHHRHHGVIRGPADKHSGHVHVHRHGDHANHADITARSGDMDHIRFSNQRIQSFTESILHSGHVDTTKHLDLLDKMDFPSKTDHIIGLSTYVDKTQFSSHTDDMDHFMDETHHSTQIDEMDHSSHIDEIDHSSHIECIGHSSHVNHMGHMKSHSTFSFFTDTVFMLEGIHINTLIGIVVAMVFSLTVAVLYETLNILVHAREYKLAGNIRKSQPKQLPKLEHGLTTIIRLANIILAYTMMLCVMTMNIWLFLSIILGSGIGHLLIRPLLLRKFDSERIYVQSDIEFTVGEIEPLSDHVKETEEEKTDRSLDRIVIEHAQNAQNGKGIDGTLGNTNKENKFEIT